MSSAPRVRLTWLDARGRRTGIMVDRPGRALIVTQAAWATLTGREPLLEGEPPYPSAEAARAILERLAGDPLTRSMAQRALRAADRS